MKNLVSLLSLRAVLLIPNDYLTSILQVAFSRLSVLNNWTLSLSPRERINSFVAETMIPLSTPDHIRYQAVKYIDNWTLQSLFQSKSATC